jgi:hypothetical protein
VGSSIDLHVTGSTAGRALYISAAGALYIARKYEVYRSENWGATWRLDCYVPSHGWKSLVAKSRLGARLLRHAVVAFEVLADGSRIAVVRDGLYRAGPGEVRMSRVFHVTRGSRPLNIAVDGDRVLFGEYGNLDACEVFVYTSEDCGKTFDVGHRFSRGDVRHVHNVVVDPYQDNYWVLAGDFDDKCGIASLSKDMRTLEWLGRGNQTYSAVRAFVEPDCLVYGMDSPDQRNWIVRTEKQTGRVTRLIELEGSSLHAATFGPVRVVSTCVQPNPTSTSRQSLLYASLDGNDWTRVLVHRKDWHHPELFQFGTIVLPYAYHAEPRGMYSGQAIQQMDDKVGFVELG